jgi:hypothetical protein
MLTDMTYFVNSSQRISIIAAFAGKFISAATPQLTWLRGGAHRFIVFSAMICKTRLGMNPQ